MAVGGQLQKVGELVVHLAKMLPDDFGSLGIINPFLEFDQFENREHNVSDQQKRLDDDKRPEKRRTSAGTEPQKILHKQRKQEIQYAKPYKKQASAQQLVNVILTDKGFELVVNQLCIFHKIKSAYE